MRGKMSRRDFGLRLAGVALAAPLLAAQNRSAFAQTLAPADARKAPPDNRFRITYVPYRREGFLDMPVRVFNVRGQAVKEPLVRRFSLKNTSAKPIKKVEISLYVVEDKHPDMDVLSRSRSEYVFAAPLMPGGEQNVEGQDNLGELFRPMLVGGKLSGNYRVEVLISKAQFEDGTVWELK